MQTDGSGQITDNIPNGFTDPRNLMVDGGGYWTSGPPRIMSFLAWNCRGMTNPRRNHQSNKAKFDFLIEDIGYEEFEEFYKTIHYGGYFVVDAQGHGGGLALMWKNEGRWK